MYSLLSDSSIDSGPTRGQFCCNGFQHATSKKWVGPGDKASYSQHRPQVVVNYPNDSEVLVITSCMIVLFQAGWLHILGSKRPLISRLQYTQLISGLLSRARVSQCG